MDAAKIVTLLSFLTVTVSLVGGNHATSRRQLRSRSAKSVARAVIGDIDKLENSLRRAEGNGALYPKKAVRTAYRYRGGYRPRRIVNRYRNTLKSYRDIVEETYGGTARNKNFESINELSLDGALRAVWDMGRRVDFLAERRLRMASLSARQRDTLREIRRYAKDFRTHALFLPAHNETKIVGKEMRALSQTLARQLGGSGLAAGKDELAFSLQQSLSELSFNRVGFQSEYRVNQFQLQEVNRLVSQVRGAISNHSQLSGNLSRMETLLSH